MGACVIGGGDGGNNVGNNSGCSWLHLAAVGCQLGAALEEEDQEGWVIAYKTWYMERLGQDRKELHTKL